MKLQNAVAATALRMAEDPVITAAGGVAGFMSPIGLHKEVKVVVDLSVMEMHNAVAGANQVDRHYKDIKSIA